MNKKTIKIFTLIIPLLFVLVLGSIILIIYLQPTKIYPNDEWFMYDNVVYSDQDFLSCGYHVDGDSTITQNATSYLRFKIPDNSKTATLHLCLNHYSIPWYPDMTNILRMPLVCVFSCNGKQIGSINITKLENEINYMGTPLYYSRGLNYELSYAFSVSEINNTIEIKALIPPYDGDHHLEGIAYFFSSKPYVMLNHQDISNNYRPYLLAI